VFILTILSLTMKHDRESVERMIRDTVSLLCRNSLSHSAGVRIQGLIGITVDKNEVMLVQFDESYGSDVNGNEQNKHESARSATGVTTTVEPPESNPRKRPRLSETVASVTPRDTGAEQSAAAEEDCDVIFITDEVNENDVKLDVKLEFDQFCSSVDDGCNYDQTGSASQAFKSEDSFTTTEVNNDIGTGENQSSYTRHGSRGNVLLRNMLAAQNDYGPDQTSCWQSDTEPAFFDGTAVQTTSVKYEQTAKPRVKQVLLMFIENLTHVKLKVVIRMVHCINNCMLFARLMLYCINISLKKLLNTNPNTNRNSTESNP